MIERVLSRRWRDRVFVVASFLVMTTVVTRVAGVLVAAWESHGLLFHVTRLIGRIGFVGGVDAIDVFLAGSIVGWLVLFALDEYKRIQAAILIVATPVFYLTLLSLGRWVNLGWLGNLPALGAGLLVGILSGAVGARAPSRDPAERGRVPVVGRLRFEFPAAGRLLYGLMWFLLVVALLERYVTYRTPIRAAGSPVTSAAPPATAVGFVLDLVGVVLFLSLLGYFVEYSDRKDVVVACSSRAKGALPNVVGALYTVARDRYDGMPVLPSGGGRIEDVARLLDAELAGTPEELPPGPRDLPRLDRAVAFRYRLPALLKRWTVVEADRANDASLEAFEAELPDRRGSLGRVSTLLWRFGRRLVPRTLRRLVPSSSASGWQRLARADTLLVVVPLSDCIDIDRLAAGEFETEADLICDPPSYAETYARLQGRSEGMRPRVVIAATESQYAEHVYEIRHGGRQPTEAQLEDFVKNSLLGLDPQRRVIPVKRPFEDEASMRGYDRLLRSL
jgi:xanthosine utilization system XapX-like protein